MRHTLLPCVAALAWAAPVYSQTQEALDATRVDRFVTVAVMPTGGLRFGADADGRLRTLLPLENGHLFAARQGGSFNLMLAHVNPLRFSWELSVNSVPDPLVESVTQFLDAAGKLFSAAGAADAAKAPASSPPIGGITAALKPGDVPPASNPEITDASLIELRLWMRQKKACFTEQDPSKDPKILVAQRLDSVLFSSAASAADAAPRTAAGFRSAVATGIALFDTPTSMAEMRTALQSLRSVIALLRDANTNAQKDRAALSFENVADPVPAKGKATCPDSADINDYYRRTLDAYGRRAAPLIEKRVSVVARLQDVSDAIAQKFSEVLPADKELLIGSVHVESGKRLNVTLKVTERAIAFKDDVLSVNDVRTITSTFAVMEHQSVVTEFTEGLAFTPVAFPRFQTNMVGTTHVVAEAGTSKPRAMLVSMFNLIPNTGWHGFTRVVGQLGAGVTTEAAALLAGGGIRFSQPSRVVLTFGAMFPFVKTLTKLKVGDTVAGEAALQADIGRSLASRPSFYIGLQR